MSRRRITPDNRARIAASTKDLQIIIPPRSGDLISEGLRALTKILKPDEEEFGFSGPFGYGVEFETPVFLMHPYCWCEKQGECPWCTGCGVYYDSGKCVACLTIREHSPDCYDTLLQEEERRAGVHHDQRPYESLSFDTVQKKRRSISNRLLKLLTVSDAGCSCGRDKELKAACKVSGCDYAIGTGIFSRFTPYTKDHTRHYYDPPNFWFKPTDFRVKWYKYIGRDMAFNRDISVAEWAEVFEACVKSARSTR